MFGKKKVVPEKVHQSRWNIYGSNGTLKDNVNGMMFDFESLYGAFERGSLSLWTDEHYLTTLKVAEAEYRLLIKRDGLNRCDDHQPLELSQVFTARNGTEFFFVGGELCTLQHALHTDSLELIDEEEDLLKIRQGDKTIASFDIAQAADLKQAFEISLSLKEKQMSGEAYEKATSIKRFKSLEKQGFPNIIVTTESVSPFPVEARLGIVTAEYAHRTKMLAGAIAEITNIGQDRNKTTQDALKKARESALTELRREAHIRGADAVIAVDLDYSEISGAGDPLLFLVVSGTAIKIKAVESE